MSGYSRLVHGTVPMNGPFLCESPENADNAGPQHMRIKEKTNLFWQKRVRVSCLLVYAVFTYIGPHCTPFVLKPPFFDPKWVQCERRLVTLSAVVIGRPSGIPRTVAVRQELHPLLFGNRTQYILSHIPLLRPFRILTFIFDALVPTLFPVNRHSFPLSDPFWLMSS